MAESNNLIKVKYVLDTSEFDKLSKDEVRAKQELQKFNQELRNTAKEGKQATTSVKSGLDGINSSASSLKSTIGGLFAVGSIVAFGKQVLDVTANFESLRTSIEFASGSMKEGQKNFAFLIDLSKRYGKDLQALAGSYSSFSASARLAGLEQRESNRIFESAVKASAALGKSTADTQGILLAFSQIISKGTVQAEELRGQIGERLPGAFNLAAKAMGVNTQQLNKMLEQGQVVSADFLPKFAIELENAFGAAAEKKVNSLNAAIGRFSTGWDRLLESPGVGSFIARELNIWAGYFDKLREWTTDDATLNEEKRQQALLNIKANAKTEVEETRKKYNEINNARATSSAIAQGLLNKDAKSYERLLNRVKFFNLGVDKQTLQYVEARREVLKELIAESNQQTKIAAKTAEQLKKEYDLLVKQLDLQKQIAAIKIQIANKPGFEREFKLLQNDLKFGEKRLALDKQYAAQKVEAAIDNAKLQVVVNEKLNVDLARLGKENTADALKEIQKMREANQKYEADKLSDQEKSLQKERELDAERVKDKQTLADKFKDIDDKSRAEKKKLEEDLKDITVQEAQITTELVSTIYNGFYNIRQQQLANELTLTQRKYAEEIRLAGDNAQRVTELQEQLREKEKEIQIKQFNAQKQASIVNAIFNATPKIVEYSINPLTVPLAIAAGAILATQIAFIAAQPVPEFKEGTKGKKFKGKAIVGEAGVEKVVTESGKVYFTPPTATLADFKEPVQIIPNHSLNKNEIFWASQQTSAPKKEANPVIQKLDEINSTLNSLPIHQITLNKKGFETFVTTSKRTTKILNNQFPTRK